MIHRILVLAVLSAMLLAGGCCATGANDTLSTARATQLNLPN